MSTALRLFESLCEVGNMLECWRTRFPEASDDWTAATEILGCLDASIDALVYSTGLGGDDDA